MFYSVYRGKICFPVNKYYILLQKFAAIYVESNRATNNYKFSFTSPCK